MKKSSAGKKTPAPKVDPYLEGFMTKLLDRFASLERKMDAVLASASAGRPGGQESRAEHRADLQNLQAKERNARRERIMYEAVCADCSVPCEVPFRPSEGRAVYCKECFAKRKAGGGLRPAAPSQPSAPASNTGPRPAVPPPASPAKEPSKSAKKKPSAGKKTKKK